MESLWSLINLNQLIFFFPLLSVDLPPNTLFLFKALAFAQGDIILVELLYSLSFARILPSSPSSSPYNSRFQYLGKSLSLPGYGSTDVIQNAGILLSFLCIYFFLLLLLFLSNIFCWCYWATKCRTKTISCLLWSTLPRFFMEAYLELFLSSLLEVTNVSLRSWSGIFSFLIALLSLLVLTCFPFYLLRSLSGLSSQSSSTSKPTLDLFTSLKSLSGLFSQSYYLILCFLYLLFIFSVFWLEGRLFPQISLMLGISILLFSFLASQKPFLSKLDNVLSLVNSFFLVLLYLWGIFDLSLPQSHHNLLGLFLIFAVIAINVFNMIIIAIDKFADCCCRKKKGQHRRCSDKEQRYCSSQRNATLTETGTIADTSSHLHLSPFQRQIYRQMYRAPGMSDPGLRRSRLERLGSLSQGVLRINRDIGPTVSQSKPLF